MVLRLALIVPTVGEIVGEVAALTQASASHAQPVEGSLGQIADVEPQPLRSAAVFDNELQQDEAFTGIAELGSELDADGAVLSHQERHERARHSRFDFRLERKEREAWIPSRIGS